MKKHYLESIDSTNTYIKNHYQDLNHLDCVYTFQQTKGKGRQRNAWFSNEDSLTFSILIKENLKDFLPQVLPFYAAEVIHKTLVKYHKSIHIKWPNDIIHDHMKLAGILCESIYQVDLKAMVIGVGINVNQIDFPKDLSEKAISIKQLSKQDIAIESLLDDLVHAFNKKWIEWIENPSLTIDYCNQHHAFNNHMISYKRNHKLIQGKCLKISDNGALIIKENNIEKSLYSGEIYQLKKDET